MKKTALIVGFIVCIVIVSANSSLAGDVWPVGSIIQSLLEEGAFQAEMGTEWVKMDGRPVSKSDELSAHLDGTTDAAGNILLPDARGKFLRMLDDRSDVTERTEKGDPEENRILGSYQADEWKKHIHNPLYSVSAQGAAGTGNAPTVQRGWWGDIGAGPLINAEGGAETRPKNIAVNYFIKIRNCQSDKCK